jgi:hypothetical protein
MSMPPKEVCQFDAIPIKNSVTLVTEIE